VEPAPVPVPAPVPKEATPIKVSLAADALFDFDKATLRPAGKKRIDEELAKTFRQGGKVHVEHISVVGHTDAIGTVKYNQKLSERRAEAVKAYIVSKGFPDSFVATSGKGETEPVASNKTSAGRQQNRRVEISFEGTELVQP
jgi:OOP family OmpA-OmpF porin